MKKYNLLLVEDDPFTKQTLSYELKRREEIKAKINVRCYISEKQSNGSVTGEDWGGLE